VALGLAGFALALTLLNGYPSKNRGYRVAEFLLLRNAKMSKRFGDDSVLVCLYWTWRATKVRF